MSKGLRLYLAYQFARWKHHEHIADFEQWLIGIATPVAIRIVAEHLVDSRCRARNLVDDLTDHHTIASCHKPYTLREVLLEYGQYGQVRLAVLNIVHQGTAHVYHLRIRKKWSQIGVSSVRAKRW